MSLHPAHDKTLEQLEDKAIRKVIVVPGRIVNGSVTRPHTLQKPPDWRLFCVEGCQHPDFKCDVTFHQEGMTKTFIHPTNQNLCLICSGLCVFSQEMDLMPSTPNMNDPLNPFDPHQATFSATLVRELKLNAPFIQPHQVFSQ